mmetsp:Transcript_10884/g.23338  ORF Transcript_10884/g.23338 Transcript_10884/m.23338 type:complete len:84 (+) Transcript_10884:152-403(+)
MQGRLLFFTGKSDTVATLPTIGFNIETVVHKNTKLVLRDAGGKQEIRDIWKMYYKESQALIFVIDCNERLRADEAFWLNFTLL